jgi:hypothetical protein
VLASPALIMPWQSAFHKASSPAPLNKAHRLFFAAPRPSEAAVATAATETAERWATSKIGTKVAVESHPLAIVITATDGPSSSESNFRKHTVKVP